MILGISAHALAAFAAVPIGQAGRATDEHEPERVAEAAQLMGCAMRGDFRQRDDQADGGAAIFARTIAENSRTRPAARSKS